MTHDERLTALKASYEDESGEFITTDPVLMACGRLVATFGWYDDPVLDPETVLRIVELARADNHPAEGGVMSAPDVDPGIYDAMIAVTTNLGDDYDLHPHTAAVVAQQIRDEAVRKVQAQHEEYVNTAWHNGHEDGYREGQREVATREWHNGYAASTADFKSRALVDLLRKLSAAGYIPDEWDNWKDQNGDYIAITEDELAVLRRLWKGTL